MKEIVKYHNNLNSISTRGWTAEEMNFFFGIIAKIRDKGNVEITLNTDEIKELIDYSDRNFRWIKILENIANKIMGLKYVEKTDEEIAYFNMFQRFKINIPEKTIQIKVSDDFEYIVNRLTENFTVYELAEFTSLKSTYSKTMYRILKQWRTVGVKQIEIKIFRELLDVPKSYRANDINKRVIAPIKKELPQYFVNFKVKVIKANTQGNPITGYKFTWQPEKTSNWDPNKYPKKATYKKKRYRSKNGSIEAKKFAERARAKRFAKIMEQKEQEENEI
jgi:plasmid replication initiation protein